MPIITDFSNNYLEDPVFYYGFEKFEHLFPNVDLYFGAKIPESIKTSSTNKKFLFATEEQIDDNNPNYSVADIPVLADYDNYQFMIENAYNKAKKEYTTEQFVKKYLVDENIIRN